MHLKVWKLLIYDSAPELPPAYVPGIGEYQQHTWQLMEKVPTPEKAAEIINKDSQGRAGVYLVEKVIDARGKNGEAILNYFMFDVGVIGNIKIQEI